MGAWPLPTGDSLVVPSRAQVYLIGPCDRSFQTTPLRLTMSSGREAHRRRDTEAGGCASPWHGSLQPPEGPPELQIRLPDVELKSTGGVPVKDFTRLPDIDGADFERRGLLPPVRSRCILSFTSPSPIRPVRERERNAQVDRWAARSEARLEAEAVARRAGEGPLSKRAHRQHRWIPPGDQGPQVGHRTADRDPGVVLERILQITNCHREEHNVHVHCARIRGGT
jgi:hypothetical protein